MVLLKIHVAIANIKTKKKIVSMKVVTKENVHDGKRY